MSETVAAADSQVHGQLAQANLLRLRNDLDGAEKALLGILRRFPNDPHAHELLGDVCSDREEWDRAIEWYELALDLAPTGTDIRRKLDEARARLDAQSNADAAEALGLPPTLTKPIWWPVAAAAVLLILAIGVATWPRSARPAPIRARVSIPVATNDNPEPETKPTVPMVQDPAPTTQPETPATTTTAPQIAEEDRTVLVALQGRTDGTRVVSVNVDPRNQAVEVTFTTAEGEDPKTIAQSIGKEALAVAPNAPQILLRALRGGHLALVADLLRNDLSQPDPLSNVWPVNSEPPVTGPSATSNTTGP